MPILVAVFCPHPLAKHVLYASSVDREGLSTGIYIYRYFKTQNGHKKSKDYFTGQFDHSNFYDFLTL